MRPTTGKTPRGKTSKGEQKTAIFAYDKKAYKEKYNFIEMENIELDKPYSITLNIGNPSLKWSFVEDYKIYSTLLGSWMNGITGLICQVFPEYSKKGRFHIHGVIKFTDWVSVPRFYEKIDSVTRIANLKFDTIDDLEKWKIYMMKQEKFMKPRCKQCKLKYIMEFGALNIIKPNEV